MNKFLKIFVCLTLFCFVTGFSDFKQYDEFSCGPVAAANCAVNVLNQNLPLDTLIQTFTSLSKTDKNGTTSQNLCRALEAFFLKTNLKTNVKYYGIRKVERKYKSRKALNICDEIHRGNSVILNVGFYKASSDGYKRIYGHYLNAYECKANKVLIADPYSKSGPRYVELKKPDDKRIYNTKDNEKYSLRKFNYYEILPSFEYQKSDEKVILNGIISIYPNYL